MELIGSVQELLPAGTALQLVAPATVAVASFIACALALGVAGGISRRSEGGLLEWAVTHLRGPLLILAPAIAFRLTLPISGLSAELLGVLKHAVALILMFGSGWLLASLTSVFDEFIDERFELDVRDNLRARRIHTKFDVLRRLLILIVVVLTGGAMLTTFPAVRAMGAGLLASAGIAGIVLGIAARPTVETLLAGVQLALTEPINLDDVVIVEGEWGRVEEIRATYVVIRIWDDRRLVVPVSHFLSQPFQNWTRATSELLGQVTFEVDPSAPVDRIREEVQRIVTSCPLWDGRFWNLQVTESGERTLRLRVLASAADSSSAWDLRCEIRERLLAHLRSEHPTALPRFRLRIDPSEAAPAPDPGQRGGIPGELSRSGRAAG